MLILLSPAKNLNETRAAGQATTTPRFLDQAEELVTVARQWSDEDISDIMKVSPTLAGLNRARFAKWSRQADCAAALMFDGDVYKELEYATLDAAARSEAGGRLRLLSGLYGLLRPGDAVQAYRLEMGRKIPGHPAGTLYRFWGSRIAEAVVQDAAAVETDMVLNLASEEYAKAVDRSALNGVQMISPRFVEERAGQRKVIGIAAKRARGAMARWALETGATTARDLQAFTVGGYGFDAEASSNAQPVFVRG